MAKITLKGNGINTVGELPILGEKAKNFKLIKEDLSVGTLTDYKGKKLVLNIFPSIDTGTCAASVRHFNKEATNLENTTVLCISRDLPFAQKRFCGAEGIENVEMLSDFKTGQFGVDYGLQIVDGPLSGLNSRSIVVINEEGMVTYTEQISETTEEPNYKKVIKSL